MYSGMSCVRSSAQYVWSTAFVLGKGATGYVYQGMHKTTADPVAVKCFNLESQLRPIEVQLREFEVMEKLNHDNIVRLLAIEKEVDNQNKVLIMELCTGGSLFSILEDPQNRYGLEEEEFLCVLKDISAGMKYLRDGNIIHRDLKPGNIMKFIKEDKRSIYKLTDFGAARELPDDQHFESLYGTEEYLHPDLYERAVLRHLSSKPFGATVDLWSIGATLYHVATGSLPFRPFGGRKNKQTMYYIMSKKDSGVISGVQHCENGLIEWSRELPKTCLLSQGLRELVTTLLAGILECDHHLMWTFEKFFMFVTDIVSRRVFHVFYFNEGKEASIYLQPDKCMGDLRLQIERQVEVPCKSQMLLFNGSVFDSRKEESMLLSVFPLTSSSQPFILLHTKNRDIKDLRRLGALSAHFPMFRTSLVNVDYDASMAKTCCSVAHAVKRLVERLVRCHRLLLQTPKVLLSITSEDALKCILELESNVQRPLYAFDQRLKQIENSYNFVTKMLMITNHQCDSKVQQLKNIVLEQQKKRDDAFHDVCKFKSFIDNTKRNLLEEHVLEKQWNEAVADCPDLNRCIEKADTYVNKIRDSWQSLVQNKCLKSLTFHDEQFHILEKVKIQETSKKLLALLQEECLESCLQASHKLDKWYRDMADAMIECQHLKQDIENVKHFIQSISKDLDKGEKDVDLITDTILSLLKNDSSSACGISQRMSEETSETKVEKACLKSNAKSISKIQVSRSFQANYMHQLKEINSLQKDVRKLVNCNENFLNRYINMYTKRTAEENSCCIPEDLNQKTKETQ